MRKLASMFVATRMYLIAAPYAIFFVGASTNQAVLIANGGRFPVMISDRGAKSFGFGADNMSDNRHMRMTNKTHLNWLADYINLNTEIDSIGDLLINLGMFLGKFSLPIWMTLAIADKTNDINRMGTGIEKVVQGNPRLGRSQSRIKRATL